MSPQLKIFLGYTAVAIEILPPSQGLNFSNALHIVRKFTYNLADFKYDRKTQRFVKDKNYFIEQKKDNLWFYIPRNYYDRFIDHLTANHVSYSVSEMKKIGSSSINLSMNPSWKDKNEIQTDVINYLINNKSPIRCLALQTGGGKSFCANKSAVSLGKPYLIITSGLVEQWEVAIREQTILKEEDIYVIKGSKSIFQIMKNNLKPKCVIASLETMRNFVQQKDEYENFEYTFQEVMEHLEIGTKIVDEAHTNFHAIVSIDLVCNIENNIYLSATFIRNNQSTNRIFNIVFPNELQYGDQYRKTYVDTKMFSYGSLIPERLYTMGSYSHFRYEKLLLRTDKSYDWFFGYLLRKIIEERFIRIRKPGQKLLIIMSSIDVIKKGVEKLRTMYPQLTVNSFVMNEPLANLESDIIVSTIGSSGTGRDIKNLVSCINTVSFAAEGQVIQLLGRLRELSGYQVYFSDIFNRQSESHMRHKQKRMVIYKERSLHYSEAEL